MRAISDEAVKALINSGICTDTDADREYVCECIDNIPTIEPKRGRWETVFMSEATGWDISIAGRDPIYGHRCSICKEETFINDVGEEMLTNFCPNCGCAMTKE